MAVDLHADNDNWLAPMTDTATYGRMSYKLALVFWIALSLSAWGQLADFSVFEITEADFPKINERAEQGDASAQYKLGVMYNFGAGVLENEAKAIEWYRKSADQEFAPAQCKLAFMYSEGLVDDKPRSRPDIYTVGPEAYARALELYKKAADQEYPPAQDGLGVLYCTGKGIPQDYAKGAKLFQKAADQGDNFAQCHLGELYRIGKGVPADEIESYKWFSLSAAQGNPVAEKWLSELQRAMSRDQIDEAKRLIRAFKPHEVYQGKATNSRLDAPKSGLSASGSGFFITDDGFLMTNAHVVKGGTKIQIVTSAGNIIANVIKVDEGNDLALLKAEGHFLPLPVVSSRGVRLGNTVATVGFPNIGLQGFAPKLSKGEIAALSGSRDDARYFQISVPVQPGNSGGALVDEHGNVVGIVSAKLDTKSALQTSGTLPENVNYAVKSSYILSFLESVPQISSKLQNPRTNEMKFEDVVIAAERSAALILVY